MVFGNKEKLEVIKELTLLDDTFFEAFAQDKEAVQEMLQVILEDADLVVVDVTTQDAIPNLYGRSVRLDACCRLGDGRIVNVEIQNSNNDDHVKRSFFNVSHVLVRESEKGTKFKDLPDVVVIYIMRTDFFRKDKLVYHMEFVLRETGEVQENGIRMIFLNASKVDDSAISRLLQNMQKKDVDDPEFPKLTQRVKYLKNEQKGVCQMCKLMEKYTNEARAEGVVEGKTEGRIEIFATAIKNGTSTEQLITVFGASAKEVEEAIALAKNA